MTTTKERQERNERMMQGLRQAIENGFQMTHPGVHTDVLKEFPGWFAQEDEAKQAYECYDDDDVSVDPHPLASYGNNGVWVQAWVWLDYEIKEE